MERITVVIPVGPEQDACRWLEEALASVQAQTVPSAALIIDDMHGLADPFTGHPHGECDFIDRFSEMPEHANWATDWISIWRSPWRLGVAHAFNFGVSLAGTECSIMLGADDTLEPTVVEECAKEYERTADGQKGSSYYALSVRYMDTGEVQTIPCGAAMVTKTLWRRTGGFAPETASGASDAALISTFWNRSDVMQLVPVGKPGLYNYRRHDRTDTAARGPWQGVILETRDKLTALWEPPKWGRYS